MKCRSHNFRLSKLVMFGNFSKLRSPQRLVQFWQNFETSPVLLMQNCTRHRKLTCANKDNVMYVFDLALMYVKIKSNPIYFIDDTSCKTALWWNSMNKKGWSRCPASTPYINGLFRNRSQSESKDLLHHLQEANCCNNGAFNSECVTVEWLNSISR